MKKFDDQLLYNIPVIGILRNFSTEEIKWVTSLYYEAGFRTLEVTLNGNNAAASIEYLAKELPDMNIGAGTVCNQEDLKVAQEAGASFIVSPICDIALIEKALENKLAVFPGALTPSEIYTAWNAGATAVKLFPASSFGPAYLKELRAPLPQIKIIPVGGISKSNLSFYFEVGAIGVGMGGGLFKREDITNKDRAKVLSHLKEVFNHLP